MRVSSGQIVFLFFVFLFVCFLSLLYWQPSVVDLENDISADEVLKCIKKLKNNHSCGYDGILNEFPKTSSKLLIAITTLFNIVNR